jgi:hypothetical protein
VEIELKDYEEGCKQFQRLSSNWSPEAYVGSIRIWSNNGERLVFVLSKKENGIDTWIKSE